MIMCGVSFVVSTLGIDGILMHGVVHISRVEGILISGVVTLEKSESGIGVPVNRIQTTR